MKLNDQKSNNLTIFPQAYDTNLTASFKYLSREGSAIKREKSILKQTTSQKQLYSNRGSEKKMVRIQESSGSNITLKNQSFQNIQTIAPMRSLNREDKEKLISTLIQQVKQQNQQIKILEDRCNQQAEQMDELNLYNEKYQNQEQCYGNIIQQSNKINIRIQQIQQLRDIDVPNDDYLEIINKLYEEEIDQDMAIKWRNARLMFNFLDILQKATKYSKKLTPYLQKKDNKLLQQCFKGWKFQQQKKQLLQQFKEVQSLRILFNNWIQWKQWLKEKKKYQQKYELAKDYYNTHLLKNSLKGIKNYYNVYNYESKELNKIQKQANNELNQLKIFKIFTHWVLHVQQQQSKNKQLVEFIKIRKNKSKQNIIKFLQFNVKFNCNQINNIINNREQNIIKFIFNYIKQMCKMNKYKFQQILLNRNHFIKQNYFQIWNKEQQKINRLDIIYNKFKQKRTKSFLQSLFNELIFEAQRKKIKRQNQISIQNRYNQRILNNTLLFWLSQIYKRKKNIQKEQNLFIIEQKEKNYQQENDHIALKQLYEESQDIIINQQQQIKNQQLLIDNQVQAEQELFKQNEFLKNELKIVNDKLIKQQLDYEEVKILREQFNNQKQQLKDYKQQTRESIDKNTSFMSESQLRKQVEMSTTLLNDQKIEYNQLQNEYSKIVGEYEKKIKEIEKYYMELCEKQKLQIERLMKENQQIKKENNQNLLSRNKLFDELNMIHQSFKDDNYHSQSLSNNYQQHYITTQQSPSNVQQQQYYSQNTPPEKQQFQNKRLHEEASLLREDIKRRLASLKTQMDQQL